MKEQIATLEERLATLRDRQDEFEAHLEEERHALALAQRAAIDGDEDAGRHAPSLTEAQAAVTAREGTLAMLAERIAETEAELEAARTAATIEEHKAAMVEHTEAATRARDEFEAAHARLVEAFEAEFDTIRTSGTAWREATRAFRRHMKGAEDVGADAAAQLQDLDGRGVDLEAVLSSRNFAQPWNPGVPRTYPHEEPDLGRFAQALGPALRGALGQADQEERKQRLRGEPTREIAAAA